MCGERLLVEGNGFLQFALHLLLIGLLEELPGFAFVFFAAFALYQKILYIHRRLLKKVLNQLDVRQKVRLVDFTPCGLAAGLFEKPQEGEIHYSFFSFFLINSAP